MREVVKFEADDGTLWNDADQAKIRDKYCQLAKEYENIKLYGDTAGCRIEWKDLIDWVSDNTEFVQQLLDVSMTLQEEVN